jgi:hypothetical protein
MMRTSGIVGAAVLGVFCACGGDATAPPSSRQVDIASYLDAELGIAVDGTPYGSLPRGISSSSPRTVTLTLPGSAKALRYTLIKRTYNSGLPIPDDLDGETVQLPKGDATLTINNVVGGVSYFTFDILNESGTPVRVCLYRDGVIKDLGTLFDHTGDFFGAEYGYYRFTPTTELRIYPQAGCSGNYRYWSNAVLAGFDLNSGTISLRTTLAPQ